MRGRRRGRRGRRSHCRRRCRGLCRGRSSSRRRLVGRRGAVLADEFSHTSCANRLVEEVLPRWPINNLSRQSEGPRSHVSVTRHPNLEPKRSLDSLVSPPRRDGVMWSGPTEPESTSYSDSKQRVSSVVTLRFTINQYRALYKLSGRPVGKIYVNSLNSILTCRVIDLCTRP